MISKHMSSIAGVAACALILDAAAAVAMPAAPPLDFGATPATLARGGGRFGGPGLGFRGDYGGYVGNWRRPYAWAPGGAIAAGAAIGVLSGADAVAYTSTPAPVDGLCWYYSDDSMSQGLWDVCQ